MRAASLFAGIGGFDLALERAGVEVVAMVEIDKACQSVLRRHFPNAQGFTDVTKVKGRHLGGNIGLVVGGFPCQDVSVAGKRAGLAGERTGLFFEAVRIINETTPQYIILENVPGLLSSNDGRDMGTVLGTLAELGYGLAYRVLDAQYFGVPQRRRRVFIVGSLGDWGGPRQILFEPESLRGDPATGSESKARIAAGTLVSTLAGGGGGPRGWNVSAESAAGGQAIPIYNPYRTSTGTGEYVEGFKPDVIHDALTANPAPKGPPVTVSLRGREGGATAELGGEISTALRASQGGGDKPHVLITEGVRRLTPTECERLQGFPDDWTAEQSDAQRYRQLGNAVAVPVVEWIARRLVAVDTALANKEGAA